MSIPVRVPCICAAFRVATKWRLRAPWCAYEFGTAGHLIHHLGPDVVVVGGGHEAPDDVVSERRHVLPRALHGVQMPEVHGIHGAGGEQHDAASAGGAVDGDAVQGPRLQLN